MLDKKFEHGKCECCGKDARPIPGTGKFHRYCGDNKCFWSIVTGCKININ
jgi:hypothetical protein